MKLIAKTRGWHTIEAPSGEIVKINGKRNAEIIMNTVNQLIGGIDYATQISQIKFPGSRSNGNEALVGQENGTRSRFGGTLSDNGELDGQGQNIHPVQRLSSGRIRGCGNDNQQVRSLDDLSDEREHQLRQGDEGNDDASGISGDLLEDSLRGVTATDEAGTRRAEEAAEESARRADEAARRIQETQENVQRAVENFAEASAGCVLQALRIAAHASGIETSDIENVARVPQLEQTTIEVVAEEVEDYNDAPASISSLPSGTTLSNRKLAKLLGISASYPSYWLNNKKVPPTWFPRYFTHNGDKWLKIK